MPQAPERILDAPDLTDDYYLNLLDWSSTNTVRLIYSPPTCTGVPESYITILPCSV